MASDLKHIMKEDARVEKGPSPSRQTWQMPIDQRDWHLLGCQMETGGVHQQLSVLLASPSPLTVVLVLQRPLDE